MQTTIGYTCAKCKEETCTCVSRRWHMTKDGRTFIMYGPENEVRERAAIGGYEGVTASGYYDRKTNTIEYPKDGPCVVEDNRKSGGGSRG